MTSCLSKVSPQSSPSPKWRRTTWANASVTITPSRKTRSAPSARASASSVLRSLARTKVGELLLDVVEQLGVVQMPGELSPRRAAELLVAPHHFGPRLGRERQALLLQRSEGLVVVGVGELVEALDVLGGELDEGLALVLGERVEELLGDQHAARGLGHRDGVDVLHALEPLQGDDAQRRAV